MSSPRCAASCWTGWTAAVAAGVDESMIVLDPGLGFAKTAEHNWALLRVLAEMTGAVGAGWGFPILIGASRKRFLGACSPIAAGPRPPDGREAATTAISALAAADGVWGVRVHEAAASLDAVRVLAAATGTRAGARATRPCPALAGVGRGSAADRRESASG